MYDNFNVLQFQRAREARQRKKYIQFQRRNNFDVLGSDILQQFRRVNNFDVSSFRDV